MHARYLFEHQTRPIRDIQVFEPCHPYKRHAPPVQVYRRRHAAQHLDAKDRAMTAMATPTRKISFLLSNDTLQMCGAPIETHDDVCLHRLPTPSFVGLDRLTGRFVAQEEG